MQKLRVKRATPSEQPAYVVSKEGVYLFIVTIKQKDTVTLKGNHAFTAQMVIEMKSETGYLSVIDWPLLPVFLKLFVS